LIIKRLSLGIILILLASAILLISDWKRRKGTSNSAHTNPRISTAAAQPAPKKWNIHLIEYTNVLDVEESEHGIRDGLREAGLIEGKDYIWKVRNAQGDIAVLSSLIDAAVTDGADLLMTMSTPTLQIAIKRGGGKPVVFTLVASAVAAGAGRTNEDHLPGVTGVVTTSAYEELISVLRETMPAARRLGTLFVPAETNSVYNMERISEAARKAGLEIISVPANTSGEVPDAALALMSRHPDAICQIAGNLTASAFPSIVQAARKAKLPIFGFQSSQAHGGACVVVARDYYDGGREAAHMAARVIRGENPGTMPFTPLKTTRLLVNMKAAASCGLIIPASILQKASQVIR